MAFLESKLRSSDFPYSAMQNMYDANRNADLEREMMLMQLAREKEKMRQERMRTNKLSEERMRGTGDAPKAQDPMAMSAVEQQMYDKYDWLGRPSDAVKAINLIQARGQDPNVARQVAAQTIGNMQGLAGRGMMAQAQAPMEPDVMSPEYQQQLLANRMGQAGLAGYETPQQARERQLAADLPLAQEQSRGRVLSSAARGVSGQGQAEQVDEAQTLREELKKKRNFLNSIYMKAVDQVSRHTAPASTNFQKHLKGHLKTNDVYSDTQKEVTALEEQLAAMENASATAAQTQQQQAFNEMRDGFATALDQYSRGAINPQYFDEYLRSEARRIAGNQQQLRAIDTASTEQLIALLSDHLQAR